VSIALAAREALQKEGIAAAVVSAPCLELFEAQDAAYKASVLGKDGLRVAVEAASPMGWDRFTAPDGLFVGMRSFGASAPADVLYSHFGITPAGVIDAVKSRLLKAFWKAFCSPESGPWRRLNGFYIRSKTVPEQIIRISGDAPMAIRVAINGFGRIGRLVLRAAFESGRKDIEFVGINDLGPVKSNAHLVKYDTVHGRLNADIKTGDDWMDLGNGKIKVTAERDPGKLPWKELGVDVALECTGIFTTREQAAKHLDAGAKRVLVSAPATGADITVVYGVNHEKLSPKHTVISNASCTTNCLAPVAYVLNQAIGIERGFMTTVHSFTGDQSTVDTLHSDLRRARAASQSMIPTSTGAAKAVGLVMPELNGKLDGTAIRVPTINVSMIDLKFDASRKTDAAEVNGAIRQAAAGPLKGILDTNEEPLVSIDFNHNPASSVFDLTQTQVIDGSLVRVLSWYDNEWGFSNRMSDTAVAIGKLG
jgi:glyceraldehyde 3-phosphate dehydrogenase